MDMDKLLQDSSNQPIARPDTVTEVVDMMLVKLTALSNKYKGNEIEAGKNMGLRDVVNRIIPWVNKFKEIGDIVVNFDPVHAALPWAAFRFVLMVSVAALNSMDAGDLFVPWYKPAWQDYVCDTTLTRHRL